MSTKHLKGAKLFICVSLCQLLNACAQCQNCVNEHCIPMCAYLYAHISNIKSWIPKILFLQFIKQKKRKTNKRKPIL